MSEVVKTYEFTISKCISVDEVISHTLTNKQRGCVYRDKFGGYNCQECLNCKFTNHPVHCNAAKGFGMADVSNIQEVEEIHHEVEL